MTTTELTMELTRRAAPLASDAPAFAIEGAVQEIVSIIATARLDSSRDDELGEMGSIDLDAKAKLAAEWARDFTRWPRYRARAALRNDRAEGER